MSMSFGLPKLTIERILALGNFLPPASTAPTPTARPTKPAFVTSHLQPTPSKRHG